MERRHIYLKFLHEKTCKMNINVLVLQKRMTLSKVKLPNIDQIDSQLIGVYEANPNDKSKAGKSYVVFGKKDNTGAIELSDIVAGKGGLR
jgi:hypothetical protein